MKNTNALGCENALGKSAFTLAELLMAVLVISIIMVALAPVITKRVHENMNVELTKVKGEELFSNPGDYIFEVPVGITTLYIQGAGGSGGGSGAASSDWITNNYTYDSTTSVSYPYNWKVPKGVTQIELTITGAGGGGGAGYVKDNPEIYLSPSMSISSSNPPPAINGWYLNIPDVNLYSNKCLSDEFLATRATENGLDACITKKNINFGAWKSKLLMNSGEAYEMTNASASNEARVNYCIQTGFCYWPNGITYNGSSSDPVYPQIGRPLTGARLANSLCKAYHSKGIENFDKTYSAAYGLLTEDISRNIIKNAKEWANTGLKLCGWSATSNGSMPSCYDTSDCPGTVPNKECSPSEVAIEGGILDMYYLGGSYNGYHEIIKTDLNSYRKAVSVRCYRPLIRSTNYNGAGGSAGAQYKKTINVLPGDILAITIGKGGAGGQIGVNSGNGSQGGRTIITHKRGSTTMGTYYVDGAKGGKGATAYGHGAKDTSSTSSNDCYEQYRLNGKPTDSLTSKYPFCNQIRGEAGDNNTGGRGAGRLDNYKAQGGMFYDDPSRGANDTNTAEETACSNGENAIPYYTDSSASTYCTARNNKFGFGYYDGREMDVSSVAGAGGGGGYTPPWVAKFNTTNRKNYAKGGQGGSGNVSLKYKVVVPGAGGGPGARLGGYKLATGGGGSGYYEAAYKVKEGDKLKITVGSGGYGGNIGQDGTDGQPTYISGNYSFVFNAGKGATAAQDTDNINSMLKAGQVDCNGGTTQPSTVVDWLLAGTATPGIIRPVPGAVSSGIVFPSSSYYKLNTAVPPDNFKGTPGKVAPQTNITDAPWQYGLDGGMGGTAFVGAYSPSTENGYASGGGAIFAYHFTTGANYSTLYDYGSVVISSNPDGGSGIKTRGDNETPTSGGGGGGVSLNGTLGKGGDGSPGYVRIRWNQAENIDW